MSQQPPQFLRIKFDNCSTQYKCKYVFGKYKLLASEIGIPIICYFGVSGHGKDLVDAMSGFGVKDPLRKAVVKDLHNDSAQDIVSYLQELLKDDPYKIHFELNPQEINSVDRVAVKITNVRKQHMLCFLPSGTIQIKENIICSCANCINGKFIDCEYQPGSQISSKEITSDNESEEDYQFDNNFDDDSAAQQELYN